MGTNPEVLVVGFLVRIQGGVILGARQRCTYQLLATSSTASLMHQGLLGAPTHRPGTDRHPHVRETMRRAHRDVGVRPGLA
jgi:hypothetical protein